MLVHGGSARFELLEQRAADSLTASIAAHMNAVFDAVAIAGPRAEFAEAAETGDSGRIAGHDERKTAALLRVEPFGAALRSEFGVGKYRGRVADHFIVDGQDFAKILARRSGNTRHQLRKAGGLGSAS